MTSPTKRAQLNLTSAGDMLGVRRRRRADRRFKLYGLAAIIAAMLFLGTLVVTVCYTAFPALTQTTITLDVPIDAETLEADATSDRQTLQGANYRSVIRNAFFALFPDVKGRRDKRDLGGLLSPGATFQLRDTVMADPSLIGKTINMTVLAASDVDVALKEGVSLATPEGDRRLSNKQLRWITALQKNGHLDTRFNWAFFTTADSREPELAGVLGAVIGSFFALLVCLVLSFPIGVLAAIYLEDFAPKNRITDFIEVNINNLAAVPSIVFGLLGLAVFLGFFGLPRSAPLVGGIVLSLMTLPTIIIAARASLRAVPPSIREAALGVGASNMQAEFHHVLPLAIPGMLTGTIVGMAQALGESAPLLMIGMVAFVADVPHGILDSATALPVQIYLWADSPERAFLAKTAAAIIVLLIFLVLMNLTAIFLRKKFEHRY